MKILSVQHPLVIDGILPVLFRKYAEKERKPFMGDEQAILSGLADLDPQMITRIHETYFPTVYRYANYRLGDEVVAEDIASETFIRLLEALHAGRTPRASLRGWLMGTASNLVNDYFRKVYKKPTEPLNEMLRSRNEDPESQSEKADRQAVLRTAMTKLTPDQQHVIALRFGSGSSLAEIAEIMGKKPNAIKQLQFRALAALRKLIVGAI